MITPERLIRICNRLGYPISKRRLTDWIQKGLIPTLEQHGQGRGMGKIYYWDEPHIVAHTLAAMELMTWRRQSKHALLMLWFNGFPLDVSRVRGPWLSLLRTRMEKLSYLYPDPFDLEDKIDRTLLRSTRRSTQSAQDIATMEILKFIIKITTSSDFDLVDQLEQVNSIDIATLLLGNGADYDDIYRISTILITRFRFLHTYFSPEACIQIIESISDDELEQAQEDWGVLLRFIEPIIRASHPEGLYAWPNVRWARFWWRIITHFGGKAILLDLALRTEGFSSRIDKSLSLVKDNKNLIACTREIREMRATETPTQQGLLLFHGFASKLRDIWRN